VTFRRRTIAVATFALLSLCVFAPTAPASFHLVQIREVYAGSGASPFSEYVELQMWAGGQGFVKGHVVRTYDASGSVTGTDTFPGDVANGSNQSTIVLATSEAEAELGFAADLGMSPSVLPTGRLDPSGGEVCWEALDCASWGNFAGSLPSPAGPPAAAIPDGMALRRSIAAGCPTFLEGNDDQDNSAADFSLTFPAPRPNSVAPSERPCAGPGGGPAGSPSGHRAPQTSFRRKPPKRSRDRTPTFRFGANEAGAKFECRVDKRPFRPCKSPYTAKPLSPGGHVFKVRARGDSGLADPSPAVYAFKVLPRR